ncbi:DUF3515 family protein [Microbacterium gorillae]|uniref:DUF3515 family protein n=1 Tax=Microbacterium gorillae TaxID=1231063 RepID=UPI00058E590F|nr:DUF3515 family protein [Microbacterium gorillae]
MRSFRAAAAAAADTVVGAGLAACTPTVSLTPAPDANNPKCADLMVALPDPLGDKERIHTDAQSTAAWGSDSEIILSCGVTEPAVSDLTCVTFAGIDWLVDNSEPPYYRVTSFGRSPAVQVFINTAQHVDSAEVLTRLAKTMTTFTSTGRKCTVAGETPTPTPTL